MRRRLIIIIAVVVVLVVIAALLLSSKSGGGPIPALSNLLRSTQTPAEKTAQEVTATQDVTVPNTTVNLNVQPVTTLQFLPKSNRFLAYGLNDRTVYTIDGNGLAIGLYRHTSAESFRYAVLSPDETVLICATSDSDGNSRTITLRLSDGTRSEAPADTITANWMPNGTLTYARLQADRVGVYLTSAPSFTDATEVARVPLAYSNAIIVPSPNGQYLAVIGQNQLMDSGLGAQIIYLKEKTVSKFSTDIVSATWSPDSQLLFGISSTDIIDPEDPTMLSWDVASKKTVSYQPARWFPRSLTPLPGHDGVYWTVQSGIDSLTEKEIWAVSVVDTKKQKYASVNLTPSVSGSIALFGLTADRLYGLGSDTAYQTAVKPLLDAAQKILP